MILKEIIDEGVNAFAKAQLYYGHGTDNAWDEVVMLVSHVLQLPRDAEDSVLQHHLSEPEITAIRALFRERIQRKVPAAYLCGHSYFSGLEFIVTPDVLVPRSPFAELIAYGFSPWLLRDPATVLDLCTGSGCIGIATAFQFPQARVDLADISSAAVAVARQNIHKHGLQQRVRAYESDAFTELGGKRYDLITCNPPYVNAEDFASMPAEYCSEPALALASGEDGLDFTRRLLAQVSEFLNDDGCLFVEVGNSWPALEQAYPQIPFTWLEFERGGHGVFVLTAEQVRHYQSDFDAGAGNR